MVAKMTEAEWNALKKKTGKREPQKVTTYYEENKREEAALKHHKERREQNVAARNKQTGFLEGLKKIATRKPDEQKVKTYYKPTKPAAKPAKAKPQPSKTRRVIDAVNRGRSAATSTVDEFQGLPMPPAWMMGGGRPPVQPRRSAPRKKRRRSYDEPEEMGAPMGMFDVPDHVKRWNMF